MTSRPTNRGMSRRAALRMLGAFGAVAAGACGANPEPRATGSTSNGWATGDGAFLKGKSYGNPLSAGAGATCTLWKNATGGPCHSSSYHRQDATEGQVGLPMRLELLVVDASCHPIPNAIVEIWHCGPTGLYSAAPTDEASEIGYDAAHRADLDERFCTAGDPNARVAGWFRAYQKAGGEGRVTFDTLYPGWYPGRAVHVHFRVTVEKTQYKTSQLFFDDSLSREIFTSHPSYSARGPRNTPNTADAVIAQAGLALSEVVANHAKQADGALLAWKAITIT